jgi:hypothetical protein
LSVLTYTYLYYLQILSLLLIYLQFYYSSSQYLPGQSDPARSIGVDGWGV